MMGLFYKKMGLLFKGYVYEVDWVDLVGEYIGQIVLKVKEVIEKVCGGVFFIDEVYVFVCFNDDSKDFGWEVIEILVKEMLGESGKDFVVIVVGYLKEMKYFLDFNFGLKSCFKFYFEFLDYLLQELLQIVEVVVDNKGVKLYFVAKGKIDELIISVFCM